MYGLLWIVNYLENRLQQGCTEVILFVGWKKIGGVVLLRIDVRYWLCSVFWSCAIANDGVWPSDDGTSFVVIGRIGLFCCPEGSPAVSFFILRVNKNTVLCIVYHTNR